MGASEGNMKFVVRDTIYMDFEAADREAVLKIVKKFHEHLTSLEIPGVKIDPPDFVEVRDEPGDGEDFDEEEVP
jgi:hypothetical protein